MLSSLPSPSKERLCLGCLEASRLFLPAPLECSLGPDCSPGRSQSLATQTWQVARHRGAEPGDFRDAEP